MTGPLTTVIIPVYNVEDYLSECIESVCKQTYDNLQIILVDDGSTDSSGSICDKFAGVDRRIEVIHKENSDAGTARNAGLDIAKGEYICFVDSDDWITDDFVEKTISIMLKDYDLCRCRMNWFWEDGTSFYSDRWSAKSFKLTSVRKKRRFLLRWYCACRIGYEAAGSMFRKCIIDDNHIRFENQKEVGSEDYDFRLRYTAYCENVYFIPEPLYNYRQRNTSIMHTKTYEGWANQSLILMERQKRSLGCNELFQPFYLFEGSFLSCINMALGYNEETKQVNLSTRDFFMASEYWAYLYNEADIATRNRRKIFKLCGLRTGYQVYSFYKYMVDGDLKAFSRRNLIRKSYEKLRDVKNILLYGQK